MKTSIGLFCVLLAVGGVAHGSEVRISVSGIAAPCGQIGCALHASAESFPMGRAGVPMQWVSATADGARCRFENVAPGTYAVAIAHDTNGNRRTDTNAIGIPREQWGVSRNVRPALRAPRFEEAAFGVGNAPVILQIEVAK